MSIGITGVCILIATTCGIVTFENPERGYVNNAQIVCGSLVFAVTIADLVLWLLDYKIAAIVCIFVILLLGSVMLGFLISYNLTSQNAFGSVYPITQKIGIGYYAHFETPFYKKSIGDLSTLLLSGKTGYPPTDLRTVDPTYDGILPTGVEVTSIIIPNIDNPTLQKSQLVFKNMVSNSVSVSFSPYIAGANSELYPAYSLTKIAKN